MFINTRGNFVRMSSIVLSNYMAGENDTALIKSLFRVVYRDQYAISKSINSLMTSFESYMNVSLPVLRLFNLTYPSDEAAVASFVLDNPLLIHSSESQPLSKSLFLIYNERSSCLGQGCKFSIEFSHQPVKYSTSRIETSLQPVRCYSNEYKNHSYDCGNGYNITVECDGEFSGYINATCPYDFTTPVCDVRYPNGQDASQLCAVVESTATSTVCGCGTDAIFTERRNLLEYFTYIEPTVQSGDQKLIATMVSTMNHSFEVVPVVKQVHVDKQLIYSYYSSSQPSPAPSYISGDYNFYSFKFVARITLALHHKTAWNIGDGFTAGDLSIFEAVTSSLIEAKNVSVVDYKMVQDSLNASLINVRPLSLELSISTNSFCSFDGDTGAYKHFQLVLAEVLRDGSWIYKVNTQGLLNKQVVAPIAKLQFPLQPPEYTELQTSAIMCSYGSNFGLDTGTNNVNIKGSSHSSDETKHFFYMSLSLIVVFIIIASLLYVYLSNLYRAKAKKQFKMSVKDSVPSVTAERSYEEHSEALEPVMHVEEVSELDDKLSAEVVNNLAMASNWNISDQTMDEHLDTSTDYVDSHFDYDHDDDELIGEFDSSFDLVRAD